MEINYKNFCNKIIKNKRGNTAQIFALAILPLFLAIGMGVDLASISNESAKLQAVADNAALSAVIKHDANDNNAVTKENILSSLKLQGFNNTNLTGNPIVSGDQICINLEKKKQTLFMSLIGKEDVNVSVTSCANFTSRKNVEISLVLDVSSSMIENSRFAPMQTAAKKFVDEFSTSGSSARISIVPFSSRVNIGMVNANKGWLKALGSEPAIPNRWIDPDSVYGSNPAYTKAFWVDGITVNEYTTKNYYWMGCIEPRSDVEIFETGSVGLYGLTDDNPVTAPFVAMDSNIGSSMSFCPPPIISLSDDYTSLSNSIDQLTSEGTTRLDAGMIAGWYTLSPKWKSSWGGDSAPENYSNDVKKVVVFMTDGQMNAQYGTSAGNLDWRCNNMQSTTSSPACNIAANDDLLNICNAMKKEGIEIYTVAYGNDADKNFIKQCATDESHFYSAEAEASDTNYIEIIYANIASRIYKSAIHITK